jgi:hypothetical protein
MPTTVISPVRFLFDLYVRRGPAVLVYQMGKVGSMSIAATLRSAGCRRVFRTHRLVPDNYRGDPWYQRSVSALVQRRLLRRDTTPVRIISPVRDPISRNVSGFFQNLKLYADDPEHASVSELQHFFVERYPHDVGVRWFDREMRQSFGIDVYAHPFDPAVGHVTLRQGRVDVLLFKIELSDETIAALLAEFLELDTVALARINEAAARGQRHKATYDDFLRSLALPVELVDSLYDSQFARHFYSADERGAARERWASASAPDAAPIGTSS